MKRHAGAVLTVLMMMATTAAQQGFVKSRQAAEDVVANKFEAIRTSANLSALHRVEASAREFELVCTTAVTGHRLGDPLFSGLDTYTTSDLSAEDPVLKGAALGTAVCGDRESSCDKKWPRFSIVVQENKNSTPENPSYTVGIARRPSASFEFFGPLFSDVPFKGVNEWKKGVAPECRNRSR